MRKTRRGFSRAGFTLIELLVVIAIIALLVSILLPALQKARKAGRKAVCESNLHQFGFGYANYATDFKDNVASFSWKVTTPYYPSNPTQYTDLATATNAAEAGAMQAVDIMRRLIPDDTMPVMTNWIPHPRYSHLVMNDYLAQRIPEKMVICPDDDVRAGWQNQFPGPIDPMPTGTTSDQARRLPLSSSYQLVAPAWNADARAPGTLVVYPDATTHNLYWVPVSPQCVLGARKWHEVKFPSQKAMLVDNFGRHMDLRRTPLYYAYEDVVNQPLFFDSSVRDIRTRDTNGGFNPNTPTVMVPFRTTYLPDPAWEPPCRNQAAAGEQVIVHYQWTRMGLRGLDVGSSEVLR